MLLKTFRSRVGIMGECTNTYFVYNEQTFEGAMIDIANNIDEIQKFVECSKVKIKYIILTHCHADHMAGLKDIKKIYPDIKILIHENDAKGLITEDINMSKYLETESNFIDADIVLKDGDVIKVGDMELKVIHTPGHTTGSISILVEDALFSGDTLFKNCYGRTDLPTGSLYDMNNSIKRLMKLSENTVVYPGHGQTTLIGEEHIEEMY